MDYPAPVEKLIDELRKLPGIGPKSAQRIAFYLLRGTKDDTSRLAGAIATLLDGIRTCSVCNAITDRELCAHCADPGRSSKTICVVEEPHDVVAVHHLGVDLQALDLLLAVHLDCHDAAPGARLDQDRRDLGLQALLRLLELLHHLARITKRIYASSLPGEFSLTSTTRPSKRSSASCTAGSFSASSRSFCRFTVSGDGSCVTTGAAAAAASIRSESAWPEALWANAR